MQRKDNMGHGKDAKEALRFREDLVDRLVQKRFARRQVRLREAGHDGLACGSGARDSA